MTPIVKKIKAIIFDMDGTIINTEAIWEMSKHEALSKLGIQLTNQAQRDFIASLAGFNSRDGAGRIKKFFGLSHSEDEIVANAIASANTHFIAQKIDFIEGFELFHQKLQSLMISTGLATNTNLENLAVLTTKMQLQRFFGDHIYSMAHVGHKPKPDPAVFLHTAQRLNVAAHECLIFEDSLFGFQAAKAAGMTCIAIKNNNNRHLLDQVHDAITNYHEAEDALKRIQF